MATALAAPSLPGREVGLSLALHAAFVLVLFTAEGLTRPDGPMFDPDEVMMVSAVALPKATRSLPDKPMRTADPLQGVVKAKAPPPPPTASDMALHKPEAPQVKGVEDAPKPDLRAELLRQTRKEALLKDMSAQLGPMDKTATSKDGVNPEDAILGPLGGGEMDPELARYISACRGAIMPNWTPMPGIIAAHPDYQVVLMVTLDANGRIGNPVIKKGTGDASFDRSAILALQKTGSLPPPPAKWRDSAAAGVYITLTAGDLQ
jgi:TonB family protein